MTKQVYVITLYVITILWQPKYWRQSKSITFTTLICTHMKFTVRKNFYKWLSSFNGNQFILKNSCRLHFLWNRRPCCINLDSVCCTINSSYFETGQIGPEYLIQFVGIFFLPRRLPPPSVFLEFVYKFQRNDRFKIETYIYA